MHRLEQLRDPRTSFEKLNIEDQVFVYFLVKPFGTLSKFTSFLGAPYKITGILSHVLYKVNCGRNGSDQYIHCNRIRAHKYQLFRCESTAILSDLNNGANVDDDQVGHNATEGDTHTSVSDNEPGIDITENEVDGLNIVVR